MSLFRNRALLAGLGAVAAVVVAVGAALLLSGGPHATGPVEPVESSNITGSTAGGLKVEMGKSAKLESDTSVRCFVNAQFVGMLSAADCAQKNGVKPGALDVGLDQSGAIAAGGGDTHLAPLAEASKDQDDADADTSAPADQSTDPTAPAPRTRPSATGECKRYVAGSWRSAGSGVSLDACVHTLFDGRCPTPGQVVYGHWGAMTLRDSPGRIDGSDNNRDFHAVAPQYPSDCSIPSL